MSVASAQQIVLHRAVLLRNGGLIGYREGRKKKKVFGAHSRRILVAMVW